MFGIVVLAAYALLMIGVTLIFTRRATSAESFHVADRRIGATVAAMSIAATWIWAPSLFTSSEMAYTKGIPGMFWFLVPNVLCLIIFIPFAKKIRRQYPEGITLTGYMAERYRSPKVKGVYSFQLGALAVLSTAVQLLAGGKTLALLTGLPFWSMTLALAVIAYSYSRFSGIKASVATDVVQLGIILLGGALLVTLGLRLTGGLETVRAGLGSVSGEYTSLTSASGVEVLLSFGLPTAVGLISGLSTVDSNLCAAASLTTDWMTGEGADNIRASRRVMLALLLVSILIANIPGLTVTHLFLFYGTLRASTLLPTVMTLLGKKLSAGGVFAGVLTALCVGLPIFAYGNIAGIPALKTAGSLTTVLSSGVVAVIVSRKAVRT